MLMAYSKLINARLALCSISASLLMACGGGGGDGGGGGGSGGNGGGNGGGSGGGGGGGGGGSPSGTVVYATTESVAGRVERVIKAMNISTRSAVQFVSGTSAEGFIQEGGPSVSLNGTISFMQAGDDSVKINFHRLNGTPISSFFYSEDLTFPVSGAVISPDARRVAFALSRLDNTRGREVAVYVCNATGQPNCVYYSNLRDPAWLGNDKIVSVSGNDRTRIFTINLNTRNVTQVGSTSTDRIEKPAGTPDGQFVIYSRGTVAKLVALNVSTGVSRDISTGGTGQFAPQVSPDGTTLGYLELCCGAIQNIPVLRATPLNVNAVFQGGVQVNIVRDAAGQIINPTGGAFGITPAVN